MLIVPTWGLSYEYSITEHFVMGLKSEIEASNYIISDEEGNDLEREFPISLSLFASYKVYKELALFLGGGIELEESGNLFLLSPGTLYEVELSNGWGLIPEFTYGLKDNRTSTFSIALGVGKKF